MSIQERQVDLFNELERLNRAYDNVGFLIWTTEDPDILTELGKEAKELKQQLDAIQMQRNKIDIVLPTEPDSPQIK